MVDLSNEERERYSRQTLMKEWGGLEGQKRLKGSTVTVVGAGAVGCACLTYLAAAGVGRIRICDGDAVDLTDLNRQVLYTRASVGKSKALEARAALVRMNDDIEVVAEEGHLTEVNARRILGGSDLICCATDEVDSKRLLGENAVGLGIPVAVGATSYMAGYVTFIDPPATPCMHCILASSDRVKEDFRAGRISLPPEKEYLVHDEKPVPMVGASSGVAGAIQAAEAIRQLIGLGTSLAGKMLHFEMHLQGMSFNIYDIEAVRVKGCKYCGG